MAQADSDGIFEYPVYLGVWTNWSIGGRATGSTITMTHRNGALLTAFIALFVTFSGSRLWRISCFLLSQLLLAKPNIPQDGLYHQRQAILRNASDGTSGSIELLRSMWAWRSMSRRPLPQIIPIFSFSIFMTAALAAASLLSSKISSAMGNEVLITSPNCGLPFYTPGVSPMQPPTLRQGNDILGPWLAEKITSYANYAQTCYSVRSTFDTCAPFVKRRLLSSIDRNATCPFSNTICRHEYGNIFVDSGYLNSQADFGINGPVDFQFNLRIMTHCAPIKTKDHEETINYSQDKPYVRYHLGQRTFVNDTDIGQPYTYEVEQMSPEELKWQNRTSSLADYALE